VRGARVFATQGAVLDVAHVAAQNPDWQSRSYPDQPRAGEGHGVPVG
jgi:hypothetical protein